MKRIVFSAVTAAALVIGAGIAGLGTSNPADAYHSGPRITSEQACDDAGGTWHETRRSRGSRTGTSGFCELP